MFVDRFAGGPSLMTCSEFVEGASEYLDGTATEARLNDAREHAEDCPACRRYVRVLERGADFLRSLPTPEVNEDFQLRLQHRIYHVDGPAVMGVHSSSGTTAWTVVAMAAILTAAAWSPALWTSSSDVELDPIVVSRPRAVRPATTYFGPLTSTALSSERGLWDDARSLLYEYSPLSQRYAEGNALRRAGLEQD